MHEPFLERAAVPERADEGGHALGAFLTMRLVDQFAAEDRPVHGEALAYQIAATRDYLLDLHHRTDEVGHLLEIARLAQAAHERRDRRLLWSPMLAYAFYLEQEMHLDEAGDVLDTALRLGDGRDEEEEVAALLQRGRVLRQASRYQEATQSYRAAGEVALRKDDLHSVRLSRIGQAIVMYKLGNLPESEQVLEGVILEAATAGDRDAEARARHDLANVYMLMDRPARAVTLGFQAYELYDTAIQRLRALSDIGMAFKMLGNYAAADDALALVMNGDIPEWMQINTSLEMLELASLTQNRMSFERLRRKLEASMEVMHPDQLVDFDLKAGMGFASFDERELAEAALRAAISRAEELQLNTYLFQAETALRELGSNTGTQRGSGDAAAQPAETSAVADQLRALRLAAT